MTVTMSVDHACGAAAAQAPLPDLQTQSALPIDLEAASSEFDRRNNRLVFRSMHIRQGTLNITADIGEATKLDFENARWRFTGNVVIENQGATVWCDDAELVFLGHQLRSATLNGKPARFQQPRVGGKLTEGRAGTIDYNVTGGIIRLVSGAWLSDGANEVTGERISYDLRREYVTADSEKGGQVRMKINPPARDDKKTGPAP
jgi:lipopolysaccharide export system protein LptA